MATYVLTGSASGLGAATKKRLESDGHRVIGVDLRGAEVNVDLSTPEGRAEAIVKVTELADGGIDGFVPFAGLAAATAGPRICSSPSTTSAPSSSSKVCAR
ncbi:dehydrogenase of uncharacterised specificity, short-chain alcohol dehydrogenase like protein [Mycolicibacterium fortuitum]|uniref:Dehydrogenase of uncharacterized specificity, short-chain alcohol dehydrogenase like protein n=1 Tax=Mycolicibacterium fortuitum TaxID=1766 RepID=A0A378U877_MYCFO|nr:dehydrogenase of uncharacterised specificity, short-chain alcohol dehydrogenase like protein [Mycolicibacterium fortuitum]